MIRHRCMKFSVSKAPRHQLAWSSAFIIAAATPNIDMQRTISPRNYYVVVLYILWSQFPGNHLNSFAKAPSNSYWPQPLGASTWVAPAIAAIVTTPPGTAATNNGTSPPQSTSQRAIRILIWEPQDSELSWPYCANARISYVRFRPRKLLQLHNTSQIRFKLIVYIFLGRIRTIAWNPTGQLIATGSADRTLRIWNPERAQVKYSTDLRGHTAGIEKVLFNPVRDSELASCSSDGTVRFWDVRSKTCVSRLDVGGEAFTLSWSADGSTMVVGRKVRRAPLSLYRVDKWLKHGLTGIILITRMILWYQSPLNHLLPQLCSKTE